MREATILDCTIRDGSYAIDFKFTAADTALVAGLLDAAGLRWIEVGHGLGLGASRAGKGQAASSDLDVIEQTRGAVRDAKIGAFFIPGIGTEADLRHAAAAGLDFVRIGQNADEIHEVWPFVAAAQETGLQVFVNFMKTYGIDPSEFAAAATQAATAGAIGVYVVDSAGGMMPREVAEYVEATRERSEIAIGFHGHSNLHLAVANSIAAFDAGATFVDTSVYGIGRSSGNVPTEVMAAVFDRLGVPTGVDAMEIVDIAESYLRPLAEHLHPHDMTAVSLGYGRFHSSYLARAEKAASQAGINPYRLIVALGRRDMMRLSDGLLEDVVSELAGQTAPEVRPDLARFSQPGFGPRRIVNRERALSELVDGLRVVAAKRHLDVALDLVQVPAFDEETTVSEFVLEDDYAAIGRLRFGSLDAADEALATVADRIDLLLVDLEGAAGDVLRVASRHLAGRVVPYRSSDLELRYLGEVAEATFAGGGYSGFALLDAGVYPPHQVEALRESLGVVAPVERAAAPGLMVVVAGPVGSVDVDSALFIGGDGGLRRADAYRNQAPSWHRALAVAGRPAVAQTR